MVIISYNLGICVGVAYVSQLGKQSAIFSRICFRHREIAAESGEVQSDRIRELEPEVDLILVSSSLGHFCPQQVGVDPLTFGTHGGVDFMLLF